MIINLNINMLVKRTFQVIMETKRNKQINLNNDLPRGYVLVSLLFSLYVTEIPVTQSRKFGYADDWTLAMSHEHWEAIEDNPTNDIATLT